MRMNFNLSGITKIIAIFAVILATFPVSGCSKESNKTNRIGEKMLFDSTKYSVATFGAGCFWCVEAVFERLKGVEKVISGYSGGTVPNPTYKQVCEGNTGHAEVCRIYYDPNVVSYDELLEVFWKTHDPTTLNRQGNDVGTQYRSAIFYHDQKQKELAEFYKKKLDEEKVFKDPVVTEIVPEVEFYVAEDYHQNYYDENGMQPYCAFVIKPKVDKFQKVFKDKLK